MERMKTALENGRAYARTRILRALISGSAR